MSSDDKKLQEFAMRSEAGQYLKNIREQKGLSLSKSARDIGISKSYLFDIENGNKMPSDHLIRNIADYYELDEDEIFERYKRIPLVAREELEKNSRLQKMILDIGKQKHLDEETKHKIYDEIHHFYKNIIDKYSK